MCFLWGVAAITTAKIWGMPGVDLLGRLPLFDRIGYPRFASFLLALSCAGLAGVGTWTLSELDRRRWRIWIAVWCGLVVALMGAGLRPVWAVTRRSSLTPEAWDTLAVFAGLGLVWALAIPLGLWWVAGRRPGEPRRLCWLAASGILLHAGAVACNGYTMTTYGLLSAGGLGVFGVGALALGLGRGPAATSGLVAAGLVLAALPSSLALLASHGLPSRYDLLARPPYVDVLEHASAANLFRSFSFDTAFQGNFALAFGVSSLNVLEAIMPHESAAFLRDRLDGYPEPLLFIGSVAGRPPLDLVEEFWRNKRYFDLTGVRHLVTRRGSPERIAFRTGAALPEPVWVRLLQPLEVSFKCPTDTLSGVGVWLLGGARAPAGTVSLEILDADGTALRRGTLDAAGVRDEALYEFSFAALRGVKGRALRARLGFAPRGPARGSSPPSTATAPCAGSPCASRSQTPI